jgi:DNA-binding MurR/RpiR family transcriptional regulator
LERAHSAPLTPTQRRIVDFLIDTRPQSLIMSAAAIADRLQTTDATVVRAAQVLGYSGLVELREALASWSPEPTIADRLHRTLESAPPEQLLADNAARHTRDLERLVQRIPPELFDRTVMLLGTGERIVWRGVGPSSYLSEYASLLCQRVGHPSVALVQSGTAFADELLSIERTDVVVALAFGQWQTHVRVLFDQVSSVGCPLVLVTDSSSRRLETRAAVVLDSGRGDSGLFASHAMTIVLIEALVLGIAANRAERADESLALLNELRASLAGQRTDVDGR